MVPCLVTSILAAADYGGAGEPHAMVRLLGVAGSRGIPAFSANGGISAFLPSRSLFIDETHGWTEAARPCLPRCGAYIRNRTEDLILTKDALYHLSYVGSRLNLRL